MSLPGFNNLLLVGEIRYIQALREQGSLRNPDDRVGPFLPRLRRLRAHLMSRGKLERLRADPLYWFLLARTRYYDDLFTRAIHDRVRYIVNIGCGSDTRALRFAGPLREAGIEVIECDRPASIAAKQRLLRKQPDIDHIHHVPIDLGGVSWPEFEAWLDTIARSRTLVMMEGVSPYIDRQAFTSLLVLLARRLAPRSQLAYDFKVEGVDDQFGDTTGAGKPFRLPLERDAVSAFHEHLGYRLRRIEGSAELERRLLGTDLGPDAVLFDEDGLICLEIARHPRRRPQASDPQA